MSASEKSQNLQLIVVETEIAPNAKGLSSVTKTFQTIREISPEDLCERFRDFCKLLSSALQGLILPLSDMSLDQVELTVDITTKGEIRLVACVAAESTSGIKLVFKRRKPSQD